MIKMREENLKPQHLKWTRTAFASDLNQIRGTVREDFIPVLILSQTTIEIESYESKLNPSAMETRQ